jgi:hypothetical protein
MDVRMSLVGSNGYISVWGSTSEGEVFFWKESYFKNTELQRPSLDHREVTPGFVICQSINIATKVPRMQPR